MEIRVVCFDIGGVMVRIVKTWGEALTYAGLPEHAEKAPTGPFAAFEHLDPYQKGELPPETYFDRLRAHLAVDSSDAALRAHNAILIEEYPGVLSLVQQLKERPVLTACLSNTNEPHMREMESSPRFPAIQALDLRVASHLVGGNKPEPGIYGTFEAIAGAAGDQIVFFDDSTANVEAAKIRGWNAIRIDPEADPARQMTATLHALAVLPSKANTTSL